MSQRKGLGLVKESEGLELKAYQDTGGVWTIGYGETLNVVKGMVITAEEAEAMLARRYDEFEAHILELVTVALTENQLGALVSLVYNIGVSAFRNSTILRKINAHDPTAVKEFPRWNKDNGRVLPGLVIRRAKEAALFSKE